MSVIKTLIITLGEHDIQVDEDNIALKDIVANVVSDMGMSTSIKDDYIEEM